ncbi:hypothetical protein Bca52824_024849 [Brassica carinata]|uniref:Uncharacterized protein n=1 Tax=Brassica carinata TaxID=52824 RepID=A0A8X7VL62_BRACI|nr:hypothetical protein Bca52824_024849 [Brassica carinata]
MVIQMRREMKSKQPKTTKQAQTKETGTEWEGSTVATRRPQTLDARCLQLPRDPPNTSQSKESQARIGSPSDTSYNRRHEVATPSDDAFVLEEDLKIAAVKSAFRGPRSTRQATLCRKGNRLRRDIRGSGNTGTEPPTTAKEDTAAAEQMKR